MKYLAVAVLLLCALVSLTAAQCSAKPDLKPGAKFCRDSVDKNWHLVGSEWRNSDCKDCTCKQCCAAFSTPVLYPKDCVAVLDKEICEYKVHKKNDPSVLCPIFSIVGK